jgi:hypothetical protein
MKEEIERDSCGYPESTVTISLEEYRNLCETNARVGVLRAECVTKCREKLDALKKDKQQWSHLEDCSISCSRLLSLVGSFPTWVGLKKEQDEILRKYESEDE